jgi:GTP-binding protein
LRQRPPIVAVSAQTRRGVTRLLDRVEKLFVKHVSRIGTGELNRFLGELGEQRPGPAKGNRRLNLLYGTQVSTRPPRFRFFVNDPGLLTRDYGYWVENRLRERFELEGTPVIIDLVRRG